MQSLCLHAVVVFFWLKPYQRYLTPKKHSTGGNPKAAFSALRKHYLAGLHFGCSAACVPSATFAGLFCRVSYTWNWIIQPAKKISVKMQSAKPPGPL
jgi:hypothetical protein